MTRTMSAGMAALLILAACGKKEPAPERGGMAGMQGMSMHSDSMMPMMRAHLDSMASMSAQFVGSMMATHETMASEMLDAMGSDMRAMAMEPDSAWTALTDSIKRDLADLPRLSGRTLERRVKDHIDRMRRLMSMHETMMQMHKPK